MVDDHSISAILGFFLCGEEIIVRNLFQLIGAESSGNSCRRPKVRAVCVVELDFNDFVFFVVAVQFSLGHREDIYKLLVAHLLTKEIEEQFFRCINLWH